MRLFIAEKPSLERAIAKGLGIVKNCDGYIQCKNDTICTCCFGHLLELAPPDTYLPDSLPRTKSGSKVWRMQDLPILPQRWKKLVSKGKSKQVKIIKSLSAKASEIVNCGDPDREGQALVDEVIAYCGFKGPVKRYWVNGTDDISVRRGLAGIVDNSVYKAWGTAAEARGRADWLIGMNISRAVTLQNGGLYAVGRVQTPVLKLICDRDAAIKNFTPRDYYSVIATFKAGTAFSGTWKIPEDLLDPEGYFTDKAKADSVCKDVAGSVATVLSFEQKLKKIAPPVLYSLTELQSACNRKFGYTVKQTLDTAQELYEKYSLTTYPRTSCGFLPEAQKGDVGVILKNLALAFPEFESAIGKCDPKRPSKVWNDAKIAEEAHTGLAPTLRAITAEEYAKLPLNCRRVYELIAKRYIACFLPDQVLNVTNALLEAKGLQFECKGSAAVNDGFRAFLKEEKQSKAKDDDKEPENAIPVLSKGQKVNLEKAQVKASVTKPPVPFSEASIVEAMENVHKYIDDPKEKKLLKEGKGIGTVATRAEILETLKGHKFIAETKGKLHGTESGRQLLKVAPRRLQSASLTAAAEEDLQTIQQGKMTLASFLAKYSDFIHVLIEETKKMADANPDIIKCPVCGEKLWHNQSKFGAHEYYFKCSKCGKLFKDEGGKPGAEIVKKPKAKCPKCGKETVGRYESKKEPGTFYWFCTACKASFKDENGKMGAENVHKPAEKCPKCGKAACRRYPNKSDPSKFHWYCSQCKTGFADNDGKPGDAFEFDNK